MKVTWMTTAAYVERCRLLHCDACGATLGPLYSIRVEGEQRRIVLVDQFDTVAFWRQMRQESA